MEKTYRLTGDVNAEGVSKEVERALQELQTDPTLRARLAAQGVDLDALPANASNLIQVQNPKAGFAAETIVIAFLPLAVKIAIDVWSKLILPRLERRYGADSVIEVERDQR